MDRKKQPNILLIMADQMRGDCMGIAGHPDVKTPYLDHMASSGIRFSQAYTAVPSCIPARCQLMTGLSQEHHGRFGGAEDNQPWQYETTLAGELASSGYYTQCVGKMHVRPLRNLIGFHHVELHDGYLHNARGADVPYCENQRIADDYFYWIKQQLGIDRDITDMGIDVNSWIARPWIYEEKYHPTNWVTERSIDFLRRRDRQKPFFLMASYVRPHPPFDAPQSFFDLYGGIHLQKPPVGDWADTKGHESGKRYINSETCTTDPDLMRLAQIGYYACISHLDNQIGRLIDALRDDGSFADTVILFTSDHGEMLGDHLQFRKIKPYEGSAHIPMFLVPPANAFSQESVNILQAMRGKVDDKLVELRDVLPTLVSLAGGKIPQSVDGMNMLSATRREYIHGEHKGNASGNQWIVTEKDKYCWYTQTGIEQYFNLEDDPHELVNQISNPTYRSRITALRTLLIEELKGRPEGYTDGKSLIAMKESQRPNSRPQTDKNIVNPK
jgi:arylsulfatase